MQNAPSKAKSKGGRHTSGNRGFWYRKGRGWGATEGKRFVPLYDEAGNKLIDPKLDKNKQGRALIAAALLRHQQTQAKEVRQQQTGEDTVIVSTLAKLYLTSFKGTARGTTFEMRERYLFDFVSGFEPRFINAENLPAKERLHDGYGQRLASELTALDVDAWMAAHPGWAPGGGQRTAKQALRAMLCWGTRKGLLSANPLRGRMDVAKVKTRVTFLSDDNETALLDEAGEGSPLWCALRFCIRLGLRPQEFWKMEARHVEETSKGLRIRYSVDENKTGDLTGKDRVIYVAAELADLLLEQCKARPSGPLWRNQRGLQWTSASLNRAFDLVRGRVERTKGKNFFDKDCVMYSCRHTFAKRTLSGYWTGKPTTIEHLAQLMGNSRDICWRHYAAFCEMYTDGLWAAVG